MKAEKQREKLTSNLVSERMGYQGVSVMHALPFQRNTTEELADHKEQVHRYSEIAGLPSKLYFIFPR